MKKTVWSLIFAVAAYTAIVFLSDVKAVGAALSGFELYWIPVFLLLSMLNYFIRFLKWQYFLGRVDVKIPWKESLGVYLAGFSMTVSPGKLGELLKCYLLKDSRGIPVSRTSPVVIAERVTDLLSMITIALIGLVLIHHRGAFMAVAAGSALTLAAMLMLLWDKVSELFITLLCRIKLIEEHRESIEKFRGNCRCLLDLRGLAVSVPLGILSWGIEAMVLCAVSISMGIQPPLAVGLALLAHSAGTIAGAVSMIPGGLGLTEITIGAILTKSMTEADAAATTLIMRFATLWFAVLLGAVVLGFVRKRQSFRQSEKPV